MNGHAGRLTARELWSAPRAPPGSPSPAASPFIVTGLRIALAIALILVVISEMVGATSGIGYYILEAQRTFKIPRMYAGMFVLASASASTAASSSSTRASWPGTGA